MNYLARIFFNRITLATSLYSLTTLPTYIRLVVKHRYTLNTQTRGLWSCKADRLESTA